MSNENVISVSDTVKRAIDYVSVFATTVGITGVVKKDEVKGFLQKSESEFYDHEYDDHNTYWEDDFYGTIYLPIGNDEYFAVSYDSQ
jgi:hypothetical protein